MSLERTDDENKKKKENEDENKKKREAEERMQKKSISGEALLGIKSKKANIHHP